MTSALAVPAFIGIGSNLNQPVRQVRSALKALSRLPASRLTGASSLYQSRPLVFAEQPDYVNAVARIETQLSPIDLLAVLQRLEADHGRVRGGMRWGPRTLDLDILLYDDLRVDSERLTVPHPGIASRPFVLRPLAELAPTLHLPVHGPVAALSEACGDDEVWRIDG